MHNQRNVGRDATRRSMATTSRSTSVELVDSSYHNDNPDEAKLCLSPSLQATIVGTSRRGTATTAAATTTATATGTIQVDEDKISKNDDEPIVACERIRENVIERHNDNNNDGIVDDDEERNNGDDHACLPHDDSSLSTGVSSALSTALSSLTASLIDNFGVDGSSFIVDTSQSHSFDSRDDDHNREITGSRIDHRFHSSSNDVNDDDDGYDNDAETDRLRRMMTNSTIDVEATRTTISETQLQPTATRSCSSSIIETLDGPYLDVQGRRQSYYQDLSNSTTTIESSFLDRHFMQYEVLRRLQHHRAVRYQLLEREQHLMLDESAHLSADDGTGNVSLRRHRRRGSNNSSSDEVNNPTGNTMPTPRRRGDGRYSSSSHVRQEDIVTDFRNNHSQLATGDDASNSVDYRSSQWSNSSFHHTTDTTTIRTGGYDNSVSSFDLNNIYNETQNLLMALSQRQQKKNESQQQEENVPKEMVQLQQDISESEHSNTSIQIGQEQLQLQLQRMLSAYHHLSQRHVALHKTVDQISYENYHLRELLTKRHVHQSNVRGRIKQILQDESDAIMRQAGNVTSSSSSGGGMRGRMTRLGERGTLQQQQRDSHPSSSNLNQRQQSPSSSSSVHVTNSKVSWADEVVVKNKKKDNSVKKGSKSLLTGTFDNDEIVTRKEITGEDDEDNNSMISYVTLPSELLETTPSIEEEARLDELRETAQALQRQASAARRSPSRISALAHVQNKHHHQQEQEQEQQQNHPTLLDKNILLPQLQNMSLPLPSLSPAPLALSSSSSQIMMIQEDSVIRQSMSIMKHLIDENTQLKNELNQIQTKWLSSSSTEEAISTSQQQQHKVTTDRIQQEGDVTQSSKELRSSDEIRDDSNTSSEEHDAAKATVVDAEAGVQDDAIDNNNEKRTAGSPSQKDSTAQERHIQEHENSSRNKRT